MAKVLRDVAPGVCVSCGGDQRFRPAARSHLAPATRQRIVLADGLLCLAGSGRSDPAIVADATSIFSFRRTDKGATVEAVCGPAGADHEVADLIFVTSRDFERALGFVPRTGRFHVAPEMREIIVALDDCRRSGMARSLYMKARLLELACELFERLKGGDLVPVCGGSALSIADTRRLLMAREMIEQRWQEQLSLESVARACGVNRAKLTRGFRTLFGTTVATHIQALRMKNARLLIRTTDLSVATICFRVGFTHHASFSRAFVRHFGMTPMTMRSNVSG